jgi:hypothetical protein
VSKASFTRKTFLPRKTLATDTVAVLALAAWAEQQKFLQNVTMTFCIMTPSITITGHAKCQDFGECYAECHCDMCQAHCVTVASIFAMT